MLAKKAEGTSEILLAPARAFGTIKLLKQLGVTAHQVLENALEEAVADGKIEADGQVPVVATVTIESLGVTHRVEATLQAPGGNG